MERVAQNIQRVTVTPDQHYEWGIVTAHAAKIKKYACIDYYFYGPVWDRVVAAMVKASLPPAFLNFHKGAVIDEVNKTLTLRGNFPFDFVSDRYLYFWSAFLKCPEKNPVKFLLGGKRIGLPSIAGPNDSLNFFVNGVNLSEILRMPEEDAEAA